MIQNNLLKFLIVCKLKILCHLFSKKFRRLYFVLLIPSLLFTNVNAQISASFINTKIKAELPPLEPLPADKTYNLGLQEALVYLKNKAEIYPYWSSYGLIINNKWDAKSKTITKLKTYTLHTPAPVTT